MTQMEGGGAQRVASLLADELARRNIEQELWFLYRKRSAYDGLPHVKVVVDDRPTDVASFGRMVWRLSRMLREARPTAVIAHTYYANVIALATAAFRRVPVRVAVQHNPVSSYPKAIRLADRALGASGLYTANVAVSNAVIESAAAYPDGYRRAMRLVYNGIMLRSKIDDVAAVRRRWSLPVDRPVLLNVGRLSRQKNQSALLRALATMPDTHAVIAGEGELRSELEVLASELKVGARAHFLGEVSSDDVWGLMCSCDAFVFPSLYEAMPMALAEAMSAEIPIIASDIAANRELLTHPTLGPTGKLVDCSDPTRLAAAVTSTLNDRARREAAVSAARQRVSEFGVRSMADNYLRLLGDPFAG